MLLTGILTIFISFPFRDYIEGSIMAAARPLLDNPTGAIRDAQVLIVNDLNVATDPLVKQVYNGGARPRGRW